MFHQKNKRNRLFFYQKEEKKFSEKALWYVFDYFQKRETKQISDGYFIFLIWVIKNAQALDCWEIINIAKKKLIEGNLSELQNAETCYILGEFHLYVYLDLESAKDFLEKGLNNRVSKRNKWTYFFRQKLGEVCFGQDRYKEALEHFEVFLNEQKEPHVYKD